MTMISAEAEKCHGKIHCDQTKWNYLLGHQAVIDGQMLQWDRTWPRKTDVSRPDPLFINNTAQVSSLWSDFSISSKCLKGEINADEMMGEKSYKLSNYNFRYYFRLANYYMINLLHPSGKETIREESGGTTWKETKRTFYHIQAARLSSPGENSLRLPVGGEVDVSHESLPCGAPRFTRMFSWTPAKASRESSENIFFYRRKLVALLFVLLLFC